MKAIPFSQALRFRRIIEDDTVLCTELHGLMECFERRGYPKVLLRDTVSKIVTIDRESTLKYKSSET